MKRSFSLRHARSFSTAAIAMLISVGFAGCSGSSNKLPVVYTFDGLKTNFVNQNNKPVAFPSDYRGRMLVMSFIYTNCPDVCPMTTNNMQELQKRLNHDGIKNVTFVTLTFDPNRDTPEVLRKYAEIRGIGFNHWDFLGGQKADIDSVLGRIRMRYEMVDSSYTEDHGLTYFINHSDECVLVDGDGRVRGVYSGSRLDFGSIIKDIKALD